MLFDRLKKHILESIDVTINLFKLLLTCLELNKDRTLKYLGIDWFFPFFIRSKLFSFNRRSSHILLIRAYKYGLNNMSRCRNRIDNLDELKEALFVLR